MVDPVSIAGLILAVPPLLKPIISYVSAVKNASEDIKKLGRELTSLSELVGQVADFVGDESNAGDFEDTSVLYQTTGDFVIHLEALRVELDKAVGAKRGIRRGYDHIKWPFKSSDTQNQLQTFQRYTQMFQLSLTVEGCKLLSQMPKAAAAVELANTEKLSSIESHILDAINAVPERTKANITTELQNLRLGFEHIQVHQQDKQDREEVVQWLSKLDFRGKQQETYQKRHPGTGEGVLKTQEFKDWFRDTDKPPLWCPGNPGAGKTVIASILIDHALGNTSRQNTAVVYAYCDFRDPPTLSASSILAALTRQIAEQTSSIERIRELKAEQDRILQRHRGLTAEELLRLFSAMSEDFEHVYIFIDAIDECPEASRDSLINHLICVTPQSHLLITSRPHIDLRPRFKNISQVDIVATVSDVQAYMTSEILRSSRLMAFITKDPSLKDEILNSVNHMASGIFLLARLQIQSLAKQTSAGGVRKAMQNCPSIILDQYNEAMKRIQDQDDADAELALKLISLVFCAKRPLKKEEVRHALAVEIGSKKFDEDALPELDVILSVSAGLIAIRKIYSGVPTYLYSTEALVLVHYTLQEYLETNCERLFPTMQYDMAKTCLTYLSYEELKASPISTVLMTDKLPFLNYATDNWGYHLHDVQQNMMDEALGFIKDQALLAKHTHRYEMYHYYSQEVRLGGPHAAAYWDLAHVLAALQATYPVDARNSDQHTPLHIAAGRGHCDSTKLLLKSGANIDAQDMYGLTALHLAVIKGEYEIADLLLRYNADINAKSKAELSPLQELTRIRDDWRLAELLLRYGANLNCKFPNTGETCLHISLKKGFLATSRVFLDSNSDLCSVDKYGNTPLHAAVMGDRNTAIIPEVVALGSPLDRKNDNGKLPLHFAIDHGRSCKTIQCLTTEANINTPNSIGQAPLHLAVSTLCKYQQHTRGPDLESLIKFFIDQGASMTSKDDWGMSSVDIYWQARRRPPEQRFEFMLPELRAKFQESGNDSDT